MTHRSKTTPASDSSFIRAVRHRPLPGVCVPQSPLAHPTSASSSSGSLPTATCTFSLSDSIWGTVSSPSTDSHRKGVMGFRRGAAHCERTPVLAQAPRRSLLGDTDSTKAFRCVVPVLRNPVGRFHRSGPHVGPQAGSRSVSAIFGLVVREQSWFRVLVHLTAIVAIRQLAQPPSEQVLKFLRWQGIQAE